MKVTSSDNTSWLVRRRYREFRELHDHLKLKYPDRIPSVPGKKMWGNQDPDFVCQRQDQLQKYMDGILDLEQDCKTRVLQRFLEIKKFNGGSPVVEITQQGGVPAPSPAHVAPQSVSSKTTGPSREEELRKIIATLQANIFDLSVSPSLLDAGEYAQRRQKYIAIVEAAKGQPFNSISGPRSGSSPFEETAWSTEVTVGAKEALNSVLGKGPIACENDLVAFFSLRSGETVVEKSSTSSVEVK